MKAVQRPQVEIIQEDWQLTLQGETVLSCQLTYPQLTGRGQGVRAINRYYQRVTETWKRRWKRELYMWACLELANHTAAGKRFQSWTARVETFVTLDDGEILSLWQEGQERQGDQPAFVVRRGDSWNMKTGAPIMLARSFCGVRNWRKRLLAQLVQQAEQRLKQGQELLYQASPNLVKTQFDPVRFWLEEDGPRIFYPPEVLGSRVEGIVVFPVSVPGLE